MVCIAITASSQKIVTDSVVSDSVLNLISNISKTSQLRDTNIIVVRLEPSDIAKKILGIENSEQILETENNSAFFDSVETSGYISQTLTNGNTKNLSQNTQTDLKISTTVYDDVKISAAIQDFNMPVDDEGTTSQVSELSAAVITLQKDSTQISVGDLLIKQTDSQLFNFQKKIKGFDFSTVNNINQHDTLSIKTDFAITKGKYRRQEFVGTDNSQGPYYLYDDKGNTVIVLIGTETVYLNGKIKSFYFFLEIEKL